jgi:uncharacterized protein YukE
MFIKYSPSPETASLEIPKNVFHKQNEVASGLNKFQTTYSRYIRCSNPEVADSVDPPCDLNGRDSFSELQKAYRKLYSSMDEMTNVYKKQTTINGKTVEVYNENEEQLNENYDELLNIRTNLDNRINAITNYTDSTVAQAFRQLKSVNLINTLLVILAVCLIYFLIFHL